MKQSIIILALVLSLAIPVEAKILYPSAEQAKQELKILLPQYEANKKDARLLQQIGLCYHSIGGAGDAEAIIRSIEFYNKALKLEPNNNEAKAWLGSATLIRARDVWVFEQPGYVNSGKAIMNAAVLAEPDNLDIRWIRVNTCSPVPAFLGLNDMVISDLEFILKKMEGSDDKKTLQDAYYKLGLAYKKANKPARAKENFQSALNINTDSEIAHKIAKEELK